MDAAGLVRCSHSLPLPAARLGSASFGRILALAEADLGPADPRADPHPTDPPPPGGRWAAPGGRRLGIVGLCSASGALALWDVSARALLCTVYGRGHRIGSLAALGGPLAAGGGSAGGSAQSVGGSSLLLWALACGASRGQAPQQSAGCAAGGAGYLCVECGGQGGKDGPPAAASAAFRPLSQLVGAVAVAARGALGAAAQPDGSVRLFDCLGRGPGLALNQRKEGVAGFGSGVAVTALLWGPGVLACADAEGRVALWRAPQSGFGFLPAAEQPDAG